MTTTDEVRSTYYGQPVIKPAHWRWLVIVYFFLGGIAGATYTIGTLAGLFGRDRPIERAARYVSFAAFLPCPLLLILDLGRPDRFLHMLRIVKLRSPMSLGSWVLFIFGGFATLSAALEWVAGTNGRDRGEPLRRVVGILGGPFSLFLSGYTGILLAATNIPLWWRASPLLSPAFVSSAYSTGLASLSLALGFGGRREGTARRVARAESICLAAEITLVTAMLVRLGAIGRPLRAGKLGMVFWPVTYIGGLLAPLMLHLSGLRRQGPPSRGRHTTAAVLTLIGGFSLRALMIFAGRESARRPEDYFAMTGGTVSGSAGAGRYGTEGGRP